MTQAPALETRRPVVKRCGESALLIEFDSLEATMGARDQLEEACLPGLADVVAASTTILAVARSAAYLSELRTFVLGLDRLGLAPEHGRRVDVPVLYDGVDIGDVATHLGMSTAAVINWHTSFDWTAAFTGFAPGFVYLVSESTLRVPRHASPRQAVPPGSVALADGYSAVYPRSTPGGWQLIGTTKLPLWDEHRDDPALIHPGDHVRFIATREALVARPLAPSPAAAASESAQLLRMSVVQPGVSATYQDAGRPGNAALGVGPSGAMDRRAYRLANDIVGNSLDETTLEVLGAGAVLRATDDQVLSVSGAATGLTITPAPGRGPARNRHPVPGSAFALLAGEELEIGRAESGMWSYIAVRGGIEAPRLLGSSSRDTHSGLGPEPLRAGDDIRVHPATVSAVVARGASPSLPVQESRRSVVLRVIPGPREDWFAHESLEQFYLEPWSVTQHFSRTAVRLSGIPLRRVVHEELQSEGLVRGAIQVPRNGQPLIFAADHPVTGGYPVVGVIVDADLDRAAQLGPGDVVTFVRQPCEEGESSA